MNSLFLQLLHTENKVKLAITFTNPVYTTAFASSAPLRWLCKASPAIISVSSKPMDTKSIWLSKITVCVNTERNFEMLLKSDLFKRKNGSNLQLSSQSNLNSKSILELKNASLRVCSQER